MSARLDLTDAAAGRLPATGVYVLFLLAPFNGLTALAGGVWAYLARGSAGGVNRAHIGHQIGLFWLGLLLALPIAVLALIGEVPILGIPFGVLGWLLGLLLAAWWLWRAVTGLLRLTGGRPPKG